MTIIQVCVVTLMVYMERSSGSANAGLITSHLVDIQIQNHCASYFCQLILRKNV